MLRRQEGRHLRGIPIEAGVVLLGPDPKVAIRAAEHILFLGGGTLYVRPTRDVRICHIQGGKAYAVRTGHRIGDLAPVAPHDVDTMGIRGRIPGFEPALKIPPGETVVLIRRNGPGKAIQGFHEHRPAPYHFRTTGAVAGVDIVVFG
jgi:hypothetical protein